MLQPSLRWLALAACLCGLPQAGARTGQWDTRADTWVATDALGRTVPTGKATGPVRPGKQVCMFYFLWLGEHGRTGPWDVSRILAKDPSAMQKPESPLWGAMYAPHHWGESIFGYYLSDDPYVLRKHAQMLADAGVDAVIFDVTNGFIYEKNFLALCRTYAQVRKDGGRTPQIAFLTPFGNPAAVVRGLYTTLYGRGLYKDLWYRVDGKPLILADPGMLSHDPASADAAILNAFTFRAPVPSYFTGPSGPDQWGWLEVTPQHAFRNSRGQIEEVTVGIAQNAVDGQLGVLSNPTSCGRSFHNGREPEPAQRDYTGRNVQEQWKRALELDPTYIFFTGWNEWTAGRFPATAPFHGAGPVSFVDEFNAEFSRDAEPMAGGHGDAYYCQLVSYVRRFKGARPLLPAGRRAAIRVDGRFDDWRPVAPEYRDDIGDTLWRDHEAWNPSMPRYTNRTGRNDFVRLKVARTADRVAFLAETRAPISRRPDRLWMRLYLNTDQNAQTGWLGCDIAVRPSASGTAEVLRWAGARWRHAANAPCRLAGNRMEISIPRAVLGYAHSPVRLDFKWTDNCDAQRDVMNLYRDGDTAPNGRFFYRYTAPD